MNKRGTSSQLKMALLRDSRQHNWSLNKQVLSRPLTPKCHCHIVPSLSTQCANEGTFRFHFKATVSEESVTARLEHPAKTARLFYQCNILFNTIKKNLSQKSYNFSKDAGLLRRWGQVPAVSFNWYLYQRGRIPCKVRDWIPTSTINVSRLILLPRH